MSAPGLAGRLLCVVTLCFTLAPRGLHAAGEGEPAPGFALPDLRRPAQSITLADYRGRLVYLDFWASWCGPCRRSFPVLEQLYGEFADRGFTVLAINLDEDTADAHDFLQRYPVSYPLLLDPQGRTPALYDIKGMPTAFLVDRSGVIRHVHEGFRKSDGEALRRLLLQMLEE